MLGKWLVVIALAGAADDLVTMRLQTLRVKAPAAWKHTVVEGSDHFLAPSGDATFDLNIGKTAQPMDGAVCLGKITAQLGGDWTKLTIGGSPAAKRLELIHNDRANGDLYEYTYVGCDGTRTWSLIFRIDAQKKDRFASLGDKVAGSVEYIH